MKGQVRIFKLVNAPDLLVATLRAHRASEFCEFFRPIINDCALDAVLAHINVIYHECERCDRVVRRVDNGQ